MLAGSRARRLETVPNEPAERRPMSASDYLARERVAAVKHELWRGEVFAMAGGSYRHNCIVANLLQALGNALQDGRCRVLPSDMKVYVPTIDSFVYPDVVILCGKPDLLDEARDVLRNPTVVIEVLSKGTEAFDRGDKFAGYRSIASLRECVLVAQDGHRVEHYARADDDSWTLREYVDANVAFPAVSCQIAIDDIYRNVEP